MIGWNVASSSVACSEQTVCRLLLTIQHSLSVSKRANVLLSAYKYFVNTKESSFKYIEGQYQKVHGYSHVTSVILTIIVTALYFHMTNICGTLKYFQNTFGHSLNFAVRLHVFRQHNILETLL